MGVAQGLLGDGCGASPRLRVLCLGASASSPLSQPNPRWPALSPLVCYVLHPNLPSHPAMRMLRSFANATHTHTHCHHPPLPQPADTEGKGLGHTHPNGVFLRRAFVKHPAWGKSVDTAQKVRACERSRPGLRGHARTFVFRNEHFASSDPRPIIEVKLYPCRRDVPHRDGHSTRLNPPVFLNTLLIVPKEKGKGATKPRHQTN